MPTILIILLNNNCINPTVLLFTTTYPFYFNHMTFLDPKIFGVISFLTTKGCETRRTKLGPSKINVKEDGAMKIIL